MHAEKQPSSALQSASGYGLYLGLLLILIQVIQYLSDLYVSSLFTMITITVTIVAIVFILKHYRDSKLHGWMTYAQGVGIGTLSGLMAGIIFGGFMLILVLLIDKQYTDKFLMQLEETMLQAHFPEDKLEEYMDLQRKSLNPFSFAYGPMFQFSLGGLVISLIASIFMRKTEENTFEKDTF